MIKELQPWLFLVPVISVGCGWLLNEGSQLFRVRREDRKSLNRILYHLILTYALLVKLNQDNLDRTLKKLYAKIPQFTPEMITDEFVAMITSCLISAQMKRVLETDLATIRISFSAAIDELSRIYPLTAYELSSSTNIAATFELLENIFAEMEEKLAPGLPKTTGFSELVAGLRPAIIDNSAKNLKKDILYLSLKIGFVSKYRTSRVIKHLHKDLSEEAIDEVARSLQNTLAKYIEREAVV
ncbi:MAG: hypothetical protein V4577_14345 [Bacteroidota bacterium]